MTGQRAAALSWLSQDRSLGPTVLVVDDDVDIREALADCLRAEGYDVHTAVHGMDALDRLRRGLEPVIIFLDVRMPVLNGFQVLAALRGSPEWRSIPVVIVTAEASWEPDDLAGVVAILRKPTTVDALLESARNALATRGAMD